MSWRKRALGLGKLVAGSVGTAVTTGLTAVSMAGELGAKLAGVPADVKKVAEYAISGIGPCYEFAKDGWNELTEK